MIITESLWPIFALGSFFNGGLQNQEHSIETTGKHHQQHDHHHHHHHHCHNPYPGHTLIPLVDGTVVPAPAWGTGTGTVRRGDAAHDVLQALENGWRHIDTSLNYKNQKETGDAIKKSKIPRKELYVTSKYDAIGGANVTTEIQTTLKELDLAYLDSYLIHFPGAADGGGGIAAVWPEMEALVEAGLVKSIGVSNYDTIELLEGLYAVVDKVKPAMNQISYSVYNALEVTPALAYGAKHGMVFSAYNEMEPITKKPGGPADAVGAIIAKRLSKTAGHEVTYSQVILDWLRSTGVLAVTTTSNEGRLKEQLVPFGKGFPLLTAEEVRAFEFSGFGYKGK